MRSASVIANALPSWGAFRRVRDRSFRANLVLLYALEGALRDTAWRDLDDSTKADLRKAVGVH